MIENFNEDKYLEANPDVKEAIEKGLFKSCLEHLEKSGLEEIRKGIRKFHTEYTPYSEEIYLGKFVDIKEAVKEGLFKDGFEHFCEYGYKEIINGSRDWNKISFERKNNIIIKDFDEISYLESNLDIKELIEKNIFKSVSEYLKKRGLQEIGNGIRKFHKNFEPFNEKLYLEKFPDIKEAVEKGLFKDGFEHFCEYGYKEIIDKKRDWNEIEQCKNEKELLSIKNEYLKYYPFEKIINNTEHLNKRHKFKTVSIIAELSLAQCTKYRVNQMKQIWKDNNFNVLISSYNDFWRSLEIIQYSDLVIFYRVPYGIELEVYLLEILRLGIDYFYDIDDPIFNRETVLNNENLEGLDSQIKENVIKDANKFKIAMSNFKNFIVSTPGLKENIEQLFKNTNIIVRRNAVDSESYQISQKIIKKDNKKNKSVKIVYATPSLAHNKDFEMIKNVLIKLFMKYRNKIKLVLIGDVSLPRELKEFIQYIEIKPAGDYKYLLNNLYEYDINLVPLIFNDFNKTKSNIKFIDAALVKVPSVCSKIGDYNILKDRKDSLLIETNSEDEWFQKLSFLIENEDLRKKIGENAYKRINKEFNINEIGKVFINDLKKFIKV